MYGIFLISALSPKHSGTAMAETTAHLSRGYHVRPRSSYASVAMRGAWTR